VGGGGQESGPSGKKIRGCHPSCAPAVVIDARVAGTSGWKIRNSKHEIASGYAIQGFARYFQAR
jgi:hypothetical protein